MQATVTRTERGKLDDVYLGYAIQVRDGSYLAIPTGWQGETIEAESLPQLRRRIWRWWFQVQ